MKFSSPNACWLAIAIMVAMVGNMTATQTANAEAAAASKVPPMSMFRTSLNASRRHGWIIFRNFKDKQYIYFNPLQTLRCRLKEIRYSINSRDLDQKFDLIKCNPQNPFAMPSDLEPEDLALIKPINTAKSVAVQVVWEDGKESVIMEYKPCEDAKEKSCVLPLADKR